MEEKQDRLTGQESRFIQQLRSACVRALLAHCSTPPVCRVSCNLWGPVYHTLLSISLSPPSQLWTLLNPRLQSRLHNLPSSLARTGVRAKDIGVLVVNCSLFNPTPSLSAMVINHFKMRSNIISYNLSGMGCSASPIAIDLAQQMLQLYSGTYALVVSTENITQNWYFGNNR